MMQELALAGVGVLLTALTGGTALGVRRLLGKTDVLSEKVGAHGEKIAAMEVRLPNGEWRELKSSLAEVHGTCREVQGDISELKIEFREHAATEKDRMCQAIEETYPRLRPLMGYDRTGAARQRIVTASAATKKSERRSK